MSGIAIQKRITYFHQSLKLINTEKSQIPCIFSICIPDLKNTARFLLSIRGVDQNFEILINTSNLTLNYCFLYQSCHNLNIYLIIVGNCGLFYRKCPAGMSRASFAQRYIFRVEW